MSENLYSLPYPASKLIPHRPPMLLIQQLLEREKDRAVIEACVHKDCPFFDSYFGILPELYIEMMAQATAAISGWDALLESKPPIKGFLVGLSNISFIGQLTTEESIIIELAKSFEFGAITIMNGIIKNDSGTILQGEIKVWEDKSDSTFDIR